MQTNNTIDNQNNPLLDAILSKLVGSNTTKNQIPENQVLKFPEKSLNDFKVTTEKTLNEEIVLSAKEFIKQLEADKFDNISNKKIKVIGDVFLEFNAKAIKLPANLEVTGKLSFQCCENTIEFPKKLKAKSLSLYECNKLTSLAEDMVIEKEIIITECQRLEMLSSQHITLKIKNNLSIYNCSKLKELPNFSEIGENVEIENCLSLVNLPETANIAGDIAIINCPKIQTMPASWRTNLVATKNFYGNPKVRLINTGIPLGQIQQYNKDSATNINFILDVDERLPFNNLTEAVFYWNQFAKDNRDFSIADLTEHQEKLLRNLFFALAKSTKHNNPNDKQNNAKNIMQLLYLLENATTGSKKDAFNRIDDFPPEIDLLSEDTSSSLFLLVNGELKTMICILSK